MKGYKLVLSALVFLYTIQLEAQNLVPNPSFELFFDCPEKIAEFNKTKNWFSGNTGTPEYYRTNCTFKRGPAQNGKGYAGLILFGDYPKAIEYLMAKLNSPLEANKEYCLSFWIKAEESFIYIDQIGMQLSIENLKLNMWAPIYSKPVLTSEYSKPIVPQLGWQQIKGEYKAKGGEQFLSIGNFIEPDKHIHYVDEFATRAPGWNSYYYIDNVVVKPKSEKTGCIELPKVEEIIDSKKPSDSIISRTVYFNFDQHTLTNKEKNKIDSFFDFFPTNSDIEKVELAGYTDSDGSDLYNIELSKLRILSVKKYLVAKLSDSIDIKMNYFGEQFPKATNNTAQGKALNRRVELILYLK